MNQIHILNGDAILSRIQEAVPGGERIVCREGLIDGPLQRDITPSFWSSRATYIAKAFDEKPENYYTNVKSEFDRLNSIPNASEINLWFENDLFCQTNYWFCIKLIRSISLKHSLYRIIPQSSTGDPGWSGFGRLSAQDFNLSFRHRVKLSEDDIQTSIRLWDAYASDDQATLKQLSKYSSDAFVYLSDVVQAHLDRSIEAPLNGRPQKVLRKIIEHGHRNFEDIFYEFSRTEGIYGFGDTQVKLMLDAMK
jgi:hypothetical protein